MNYWIIGDTHFGHNMLVEKNYRILNFEEEVLKNLKVIQENDIVICLGDVAFYSHAYWVQEMMLSVPKSVKWWLCKGNHDRKSNSWYLSQGFAMVCESFYLKQFGYDLIFSHCPVDLNKENSWLNIHAHFHDSDHRRKEPKYNGILTNRHKLFALETTKYKPVLLRDMVEG